jgi:hypothetical protein
MGNQDDRGARIEISKSPEVYSKGAGAGISFGCALAMVISYANWNSIGWAILHGILGWLYVIYYALKY